jgi:presenilin-like A22 family membrane protease
MKFNLGLFVKEAGLFAATLALGMVIAYRYFPLLQSQPLIQPSSVRPGELIGLLLVLVLVWLATRVPVIASWLFWIFMAVIVLSGTQLALGVFVSDTNALLGSLLILTAFLLLRYVIIHDLVVIAAIAGITSVLGLMITPLLAVIAFVLLSVYDIIAVYKTRHMVHMAEGMIRSGAIFGFIIPLHFKKFFAPIREAQARVGQEFTILGSGDIGLPVVFAASLMRQSVNEAIFVAIFSVLGLLLTHMLFMSQKKRQPMAALPPIATMTILGYVISLLSRF